MQGAKRDKEESKLPPYYKEANKRWLESRGITLIVLKDGKYQRDDSYEINESIDSPPMEPVETGWQIHNFSQREVFTDGAKFISSSPSEEDKHKIILTSFPHDEWEAKEKNSSREAKS